MHPATAPRLPSWPGRSSRRRSTNISRPCPGIAYVQTDEPQAALDEVICHRLQIGVPGNTLTREHRSLGHSGFWPQGALRPAHPAPLHEGRHQTRCQIRSARLAAAPGAVTPSRSVAPGRRRPRPALRSITRAVLRVSAGCTGCRALPTTITVGSSVSSDRPRGSARGACYEPSRPGRTRPRGEPGGAGAADGSDPPAIRKLRASGACAGRPARRAAGSQAPGRGVAGDPREPASPAHGTMPAWKCSSS